MRNDCSDLPCDNFIQFKCHLVSRYPINRLPLRDLMISPSDWDGVSGDAITQLNSIYFLLVEKCQWNYFNNMFDVDKRYQLAITNDESLDSLFKHVMVVSLSHVHAELPMKSLQNELSFGVLMFSMFQSRCFHSFLIIQFSLYWTFAQDGTIFVNFLVTLIDFCFHKISCENF